MDESMKILVVDDFSTMRRIIKKLLCDLGFSDIEEADDGLSALPVLLSGNFDFVITDWNMPGMSGLELVEAIRANEETANLPVLMITAEARRPQIIAAAEAGVNGYVIKPFTSEVLEQKILEIFSTTIQA
ncbi:MAG: two-component system chemotaxis response regulator CheY [Gammaproteobacteria bacterium]|jgi:two-component system chemotaxis response regulator CheY